MVGDDAWRARLKLLTGLDGPSNDLLRTYLTSAGLLGGVVTLSGAMTDMMKSYADWYSIKPYQVRDHIMGFGPPPQNLVAPVASGLTVPTSVLSTTNGTWSGYPAPTFTYQWKADGVPIVGATANTYVVQAGDIGKSISVTVYGTNTTLANVPATSNGILITA